MNRKRLYDPVLQRVLRHRHLSFRLGYPYHRHRWTRSSRDIVEEQLGWGQCPLLVSRLIRYVCWSPTPSDVKGWWTDFALSLPVVGQDQWCSTMWKTSDPYVLNGKKVLYDILKWTLRIRWECRTRSTVCRTPSFTRGRVLDYRGCRNSWLLSPVALRDCWDRVDGGAHTTPVLPSVSPRWGEEEDQWVLSMSHEGMDSKE